ncbi:hypothetical protein [Streptomyces sp. NPDC053755]|uniref:hypothetical protein n=1 Tax=Streptomyces sp. NPDC053755 TaxID=3155815 RepID=UPI00341CF5C0
MNRGPTRLRVLTALPFLLALVLHLTLLALWSDRLPDPLATHFSAADGGRADGLIGLTGFVLVSCGLLLVAGTGWTLLTRRGTLWGAWATAGFTTALFALLLRDNLDATDAGQVVSPLVSLMVAAGAAALTALAGLALTRCVPREPARPGAGGADGPRLPLGASEVAGWSRATDSRSLTVVGAVSAAAGLVGLAGAYPAPRWLGLALLAPGLLVLLLARVRVTVDRRGVTVRPALAPWPRVGVPLEGVEGAVARDVDAVREFGGWGYRVRAHRTGLVLRSGEALVVRREGGREFAVTVPDAATAAALLNTLVERRGRV